MCLGPEALKTNHTKKLILKTQERLEIAWHWQQLFLQDIYFDPQTKDLRNKAYSIWLSLLSVLSASAAKEATTGFLTVIYTVIANNAAG